MHDGTPRRWRLALLFVLVCAVVAGGLSEVWAAYETVARSFWSGTNSYAYRTRLASGDVNGDGYSDVIQFYQRTSTSSAVYVLRSNGGAMARSTAWIGTMEFAKTQIASGDYDGDGRSDLFLLRDRGRNTCSVYVMTSNGTTLGTPREVYRSSAGAMAFSRARLTAGDTTGDHKAEAIVLYESASGRAKTLVIAKPYAQVQGRVTDARTGASVVGATVTLYDASSNQIAQTTSGGDGSFTLSAPAGSGYSAAITSPGFLTGSYWGISATTGSATSLESVRLVPSDASASGMVSGAISNALDGNPAPGLAIGLRTGMNNTTGALLDYWTTTAGDGSYSFSALPGGVYTAQVTGTGFTTTYFTIVCVGGQSNTNQNMSVTPVLSGNELRVVLTWGSTPADLDSHLTGPISGSTRFHVYFSGKRYPSDEGVPVVANLDTDERGGYGPETITLSRTSGGVYRYSVYDYSNGSSSDSTALSTSGAQVRVYQGSSLIRTFNVPNARGTLWKVFEVSGTTITPLNAMSYHSSGSSLVP